MSTPPRIGPDFHPLIVLWGFPELSQTFIHREIAEWKRIHPGLRILAGEQRDGNRDAEVRAWAETITRYLPPPWIWAPRGLLRGLLRPRRFWPVLVWMATRPHRSLLHRFRGIAMCLAAADTLPWLGRGRFDYIHAHFASYHTEWAMCLARLGGVPWGGSWHAVDIWKDANILPEKLRDAAVVLTCTRHNFDRLAALAPDAAGRIRLAYHGIPFDRLDAALGDSANPADVSEVPELIAIGRLVEKKGFHHLLEACGKLRDQGVSFRVCLVGKGPEEVRLRDSAARLGIADRVEFAGAMPNADVFLRIRRGVALVAPSVRGTGGDIDGIPNVVLEAMAMERPVAGSDFSGIPEVVRHGETGLLFPPGDAVALSVALRALLLDPERARAMGRAASAFVREHFDARRNAQRQLEWIREALDGRR